MILHLAKQWLAQEAQQSLQVALVASRPFWRPPTFNPVVPAGPITKSLKDGINSGNLGSAGVLKSGLNSILKHPLTNGGTAHWLYKQAPQSHPRVAELWRSRAYADKLKSFVAQPIGHAQSWQHHITPSQLSVMLEGLKSKLALKAAPQGKVASLKLQRFSSGASFEALHRLRALGSSVIRANGFQEALQRFRQQLPVLRGSGYRQRFSYQDPSDPRVVLFGLIGVNVAVWLLWKVEALQPFMIRHFLASVDSIASLRLHTAITANFSHTDATHLGLNMLSLYIFGESVGYRYGAKALLGLYLAGGLGCIAGHCLYWTVFVPWKEGYRRRFYDPRRTRPVQGASGSVNALLLCSILTDPFRIIIVNFIPLPAIALGALVLYTDLSGAFNLDHASRVGYAGHLGGAAVGLATWMYLRRFRYR